MPGVRLGEILPDEPRAAGRLLIAVTECNTDEEIDRLVGCLSGRKAA